MFVLCGGSHCTLDNFERIQHALNAYDRIKQPDAWARWINQQKDKFNKGNITVCQDFMNLALGKYNQISLEEGKFKGSTMSVQEEIVTMMSNYNKQKPKRKRNDNEDPDEGKKTSKKKKELPPF